MRREPRTRAVGFFASRIDVWAARFVEKLESETEVRVVRIYCQSENESGWEELISLFRRRGVLAPLLLVQRAVHPVQSIARGEFRELRAFLSKRAASIRHVEDVHSDEVLEEVRDLEPELGLIYGGPILRPELFEIPGSCTLGIHHGKLPEFRGKKSTFWAMLQGEETTGVSIMKIDEGLDTGAVVASDEVSLRGRSLGEARRALYERGVDLYVAAVDDVLNREVEPREQREGGEYYSDPDWTDYARFLWVRFKRWISDTGGA